MNIYKITNLINGKIYIGQTILSIELRFKLHCNSKDRTMPIGAAIRKYGKENFKTELLASCSNQKTLDKFETVCIAKYKSQNSTIGYNILAGGYHNGPTAEGRAKISAYHKGRPKTKEHSTKVGLANKGKKRSSEVREAQSRRLTAQRGKCVVIVNLTTKKTLEFDSICSAARVIEIPKQAIMLLLKNKTYTYKNYKAFLKEDFVNLTEEMIWFEHKTPINSVKVKLTNKTNNENFVFNTITEAAKFLNVSVSAVARRLNGATRKDKNLHSYTFERI